MALHDIHSDREPDRLTGLSSKFKFTTYEGYLESVHFTFPWTVPLELSLPMSTSLLNVLRGGNPHDRPDINSLLKDHSKSLANWFEVTDRVRLPDDGREVLEPMLKFILDLSVTGEVHKAAISGDTTALVTATDIDPVDFGPKILAPLIGAGFEIINKDRTVGGNIVAVFAFKTPSLSPGMRQSRTFIDDLE